MESLQQKLQMVEPNHVEAVDGRLSVILQKLNQINEKKQQLDTEDIGKVGP